jgi:hypothetical protein
LIFEAIDLDFDKSSEISLNMIDEEILLAAACGEENKNKTSIAHEHIHLL